jgi:hypothetical protein
MDPKNLIREQVEQIVREAREKKERPNLSEADLIGADLIGADLRRAYLSGAYLSGAYLSEADLSGAYLSGADLSGADLSEANLSGTNLSGAYLRWAYLRLTKLDSTNFSNAILEDTNFTKVDLSQAKGLTEVIHRGPSNLDINTIYQSKDKIPEPFLKGAGVHPDIIRWQHSLHTPTVFICYSHKDEKEKDQLVTHLGALKKLDLIDIWDDRQITPGTVWEQEVLQAITRSTVALLLVSANFLNSEVINNLEIPQFLERHAKDETFMMYPIIIKPCSWKAVPWLQRLEVRPKGGKAMWSKETEVEEELAKIADEVIEVIKNRWHR